MSPITFSRPGHGLLAKAPIPKASIPKKLSRFKGVQSDILGIGFLGSWYFGPKGRFAVAQREARIPTLEARIVFQVLLDFFKFTSNFVLRT